MVFSLQVTRKLMTTSCLMARRLTKRGNPGLGHQLTAVEGAVQVIESDPEGFEDLERDLFDAHKSHKEYEADLRNHKDTIRLKIVKNKYFRNDPLPNMLTFAEKEHIRFLHSSDEDEWTVEKLAESFPANTEIIRKILKARWYPLSPKRIYSHDAKVLENWKQFKNGHFEEILPIELIEHLKKFAERKANEVNISENAIKTFEKKQWKKPCSNEFSSIISSIQKKCINTAEKSNLLEAKEKEIVCESLENETYIRGEISNKKPITITELKNKQIIKTNVHALATNDDRTMGKPAVQKNENMSETGIVNFKNSSLNANTADYTEKFVSSEITINEFDKERFAISTTKNRIHIPRKLWRKGATYRANDCYYDDDGDFLYKVPGMTS